MKRENSSSTWNSYWGNNYNQDRKNQYRQFLQSLSQTETLGRTLIDVGCGLYPVTSELSDLRHRKIYLDISQGIQNQINDESNLFVQTDLHRLLENNHRDFKRYMKKICRFVGNEELENSRSGFKPSLSSFADSIVYSDIINYIDYQQVFKRMYQFLKIGGRKIIFNKINMGIYELLSDKRPKSNWELLMFLQKNLRMVIEYRHAMPLILGDHDEIDRAVYILIARKISL